MRAKSYKVKAAHDELAKKMEERGDPAAARAGERVQFIRYSGGAETIEDPLQVRLIPPSNGARNLLVMFPMDS